MHVLMIREPHLRDYREEVRMHRLHGLAADVLPPLLDSPQTVSYTDQQRID